MAQKVDKTTDNYSGRVVYGTDFVTGETRWHFMLVHHTSNPMKFYLGNDYPLPRILTKYGCPDDVARTTQDALLEAVDQGRLAPGIISALDVFQHTIRVAKGNKEAADFRLQSGLTYNYEDHLTISTLPSDPLERRVGQDFTSEKLDHIYAVVPELTSDEIATGIRFYRCAMASVEHGKNTWQTLVFFVAIESSGRILIEEFLNAHRFNQRDIETVRKRLIKDILDPNDALSQDLITPDVVLSAAMQIREPEYQRYYNTIDYPNRRPQVGDIIQLPKD